MCFGSCYMTEQTYRMITEREEDAAFEDIEGNRD